MSRSYRRLVLAISMSGAGACASNAADAPSPLDAGAPSAPFDAGRETAPPPGPTDALEDAAAPAAEDAAPADALSPPDGPPGSRQIVVAAGAFDRQGTIVSFPLPGGAGKSFALHGDQGSRLVVQVDASGFATF